MTKPHLTLYVVAAFALSACSKSAPLDSSDSGTTAASPSFGNGQLALQFAIDEDIAEVMEAPIGGTFLGEIYDAVDVSAIGPADGATPIASISVGVTVSPDGSPTETLYTSPILTPEEVTILGALDMDQSGGASSGEPVTIPNRTTFDVPSDATTAVIVEFTMRYPGR